MRAAILAAAVLLAGCAPAMQGANEAGGIVRFSGSSEGAAFAAADAHCRQHGRAARVTQVTEPARLVFDCR